MLSKKQHFLQSKFWAQFQQSRGRTVIERVGDGWTYLAIVEPSIGGKRLYCPYGPIATTSDRFATALESLKQAAEAHQASVLRIQPTGFMLTTDDVRRHNLSPIAYSQPVSTWRLDLAPPLDELYAAMKQNTRNICRNYQKKGLSYRSTDDPAEISHLTRLLRGVASHNHITVHDDDYFRLQAETFLPSGDGKLHFIEFENRVIAAALTYQHDGVVSYAHAAADYEHRKLGASTALLGEIIVWAKQQNYETLDFFGIAATDDPADPQAGFTRFKQSFGGYRVDYNSTYELPLRPIRYRMITTLRSLYRRFR